ncbi:hypothetical protein M407DRAFT_27262 [Tulasnella calospora MUT 4182]|uniref:Uncharacterized protein n=1 Tax=Tulasnella calospora MUT 4182 TaxID=1051891 RepID=A0A0C3QCT8_9AGAM|nr:hypothetical protein M407DRAFT_27262 [Tulasnella calospora MUT 4182]
MSNSSSIRALERFSVQVSASLVKGRSILRQLPVVGRLFRKNLKNIPLQTGRATHIVITSLSYPGMYRVDDDFYRHEGNSINFTIINDFDVDFTDSAGVKKIIPRVDASRNSIRSMIQQIMRSAEPNSKIAFFFGGHGEYAEVNMMGLATGEGCDFQCIIAGDGRRIYGKELRSWFCDARYSSVVVTVQISAAQPDQSAYSRTFNDGYYGQLTHSLIQYLKDTDYPTMEGLVAHLYTNCDSSGDQEPQVCASRKIKGPISLF